MIKTGEKAKSYLEKVLQEGNFEIYELPQGNEDLINSHYQEEHDNGDIPDSRAKQDSDARVVDTYNLIDNNCVSKTKEGAAAGGVDIKSSSPSPRGLAKDLQNQSRNNDNVNVIYNPNDFLEFLIWQMAQ